MKIEFLGAARTVTGSMHVVRGPNASVLLECGLFQGRRRESFERNRRLPIPARGIDAVVLSHAHIDHSGALPRLYKNGFRGSVYTTPATRDLCAAMLEDAAMIQENDARFVNKLIERDRADMEPIEPLYDHADVVGILNQMVTVGYHKRTRVADGIDVTFYDAGHVLGSAIVALDVDDVGMNKRVVFTGDLGRRHMPILRDPEIPERADFLITESTYGDRVHDPIERMDDDLAEIVKRTYERGGKVIIPSFALERAQEVVFALKRLQKQDRLPKIPVYVDSPLTVRITDVFRVHPECFDEEAREMVEGLDSPFDFEDLSYVSSVDDSKAIDASSDPSIIISASGMCEFGRIVHHLKAGIGNKDNTVLIVGFQAQHTLGRRLVEGRTRVRIFGVERERRCEVRVLNGFSAHADRDDLVDFAEKCRDRGKLKQIALVHGEPKAQDALAGLLDDRRFPTVHAPEPGAITEL
jgi:metallo-beta-lactamase family protein